MRLTFTSDGAAPVAPCGAGRGARASEHPPDETPFRPPVPGLPGDPPAIPGEPPVAPVTDPPVLPPDDPGTPTPIPSPITL